MIVAYIDAFRGRFGVEPICAVLTEHGITIAPSTYHAHQGDPGLAGGAAGGVSGQRTVTFCGSGIGACTGSAHSVMLPVALAWTWVVTRWDG